MGGHGLPKRVVGAPATAANRSGRADAPVRRQDGGQRPPACRSGGMKERKHMTTLERWVGEQAGAEIAFPVTGMTCVSCVRRIEKALKKVDGVPEASVNPATEKATVTFAPIAVDFGAIRSAVARAGYGVGP